MNLFSKSDRRGLLVLEWLAVFALGLLWAYSSMEPRDGKHAGTASTDSLSAGSRRVKPSSCARYTYAVPEEPVESFPFDPNTADSTTLLRLGLAPWQVQAIYRYRAKHGRYHSPEDFKRLPGMTQELWERLGKYVTIAEKYRYTQHTSREAVPSRLSVPATVPDNVPSQPRVALQKEVAAVRPDSLRTDSAKHYPEKFHEKTLVDINVADTNLLKRIPGIGSYRAAKIVAYRDRLGGYTHPEQAMEACNMPDDVLEWFTLEPVPVRMLDVNRASVRQLMRHPYISFYQAKAIVEHRDENGPIKQIGELLRLEKFSSADIERLQPYLLFR